MDLFLPAATRRDILRAYGHQHGLRVFVETGTNEGDTPWALSGDFDTLFTIELDPGLAQAATARFAGYPHITCLQGDSTAVLPHVLTLFDGPALVWLDGHFSGPNTAHGPLSTPIRAELAALFADGRRHVILIDDARIFDGEAEHGMYAHYADYPALSWVQDLAGTNGYDYELADDIVRLVPR